MRNCAIIPFRKIAIKNNPHIFEKIRSALLSRLIDPGQNVHRHLQSRGGLRRFHEVLGDADRMEHHALAGARDVRKQPMLNGVML